MIIELKIISNMNNVVYKLNRFAVLFCSPAFVPPYALHKVIQLRLLCSRNYLQVRRTWIWI